MATQGDRDHGQIVVVTGGASGIGRAVVQRFAAAGASVVVADLDEAGAKTVADEATHAGPGRAVAIGCDVTDEAQVLAAVDLAIAEFGALDVMVNNAGICILGPLATLEGAEFGALDVMVNNAGICILGPLATLEGADFDRMIAVNLKGTFYGIKAAATRMTSGGSIISTASTAGLNGAPLIGAYGATKAGIINLTKTAAAELRPSDIRVNCVCPAFTDTPFSDALIAGFEAATGTSARASFAEKQGRLGQPDDIAKIVVHLASDDAGWVTGIAYTVDDGLMAASI